MKIKIFITYDKLGYLFKTKILTPIQVGRDLAENSFDKYMLGDNTGENISSLFPYYGEITSQYWCWKNYNSIGNPERIGFMVSSRHFIFNDNFVASENDCVLSSNGSLLFESSNDEYIESIGLSDAIIEEYLNLYDVFVCKKQFSSNSNANTIFDDYYKVRKISFPVLETCFEIIENDYADYAKYVNKIKKTKEIYVFSMHTMPRELFFECCSFVFGVLTSLNDRCCYEISDADKFKLFRDMGDYIFSVFVLKVIAEHRYSIKTFAMSTLKNSFFREELVPYFNSCSNAIACSSSNLYIPYLSVYIQSLLCNIAPDSKYDIVIFESDVTELNKKKILDLGNNYSNVKIRFYNVNYLFDKKRLFLSHKYFAKQCYYRLALGEIFKKYNKVLFTDIDLIFNVDPNLFFDFDLKSNPIAAVEEILWSRATRKNKQQLNRNIEVYLRDDLDGVEKYFNTGVVLVDVQLFNNYSSFEKLLDEAVSHNFINQEQCVLNKVFKGHITELPCIYNFEVFSGIYGSSLYSNRVYMLNASKAYVYHFLTDKKAWFHPDLPFADRWWGFARKSSFYEVILERAFFHSINSEQKNEGLLNLRTEFQQVHFPNINKHFDSLDEEFKFFYVLENRFRFNILLKWFSFVRLFLFGKKYIRYNNEYLKLSKLLEDANSFKKKYEERITG